jgi:superfamily I DNA/RNA helicase
MERSDGAHGKYGTQYHGTQILEDTTCWRALLLVRDHWPNQNAVDFDRNWSAWKDENALFDFEDLIERATTDCFRAPGNPAVIYLDEAQDSSPAELRLAQIWGEMAGALVCVGDPDQAIYSWRGADPDSFLAMTTPEHRRVLSQSYRVPREVHRVATDWIGRMYGREPIEYYPRVDERGETVRGKVRREPYTNKYPDMIVQEAQIAAESGRTVMVLASCDYMLCTLIRRLRDRGVPYHNPYRVKRGDWNPLRGAGRLLDYLAPSREAWGDAAQPWTWDRLWSWIEVVDARLLKRLAKMQIKTMAAGEDTAARPIADTIRGALARLEREVAADGVSLWDGTPGVLRSLLLASRANQMEYSIRVAENRGVAALRERPQIVVGTIHSVKGGEADVVYLLPDISPSAAAEMERSPDGLRAHLRLFYVAMTRAREELVLCSAASRHAAWR